MKKMMLLFSILLVSCVTTAAFAKDNDTGKATSMVKKAIEYYKANGLEKLMTEVNNPKGQFVEGAYYVWLYDLDGNCIAHAVNTKLVGQNVMAYKDADGKEFVKEIIQSTIAKGSSWTDYKYKNPRTNEVEPKSTFCEKVEDIMACCGIYK
jgi:cytochrome c